MDNYAADSIKALSDREHVRLRPSMYISSTDYHGINQLIYEVCDNSVDEFLVGYGKTINVTIYKDCSVRIRDFGRGVPCNMTKDAEGKPINSLTLAFSKLMSGAKYTSEAYQYSAGMFGVGTSAVNFLSEFFIATVHRDGNIYQQKFERGLPVTDVQIIGHSEKDESGKEITGTEIFYKPDIEIFKQSLKPSNDVRSRLIELAVLNSGLTINFTNELTDTNETFIYDQGITNYLQDLVNGKKLLFDNSIYINDFDTVNNIKVLAEIAFIYTNELESTSSIRAFVNNINTYMGGTQVNGLKAGLKEVFNEYGIKAKLFKEPIETKYYLDGLYAIISIKVQNPSFEGQTKVKLNTPEVEIAVTNIIKRYFNKNKSNELLNTIVSHTIQVKEAELAAKKARSEKRSANKVSRAALPAQLADCVNAGTQRYSELIVAEGESGSGCTEKNTLIHLVDNRDVAIVDLVKEHNEGKQNYVFCCDNEGNIHVRKIVNAFQTKFAKKLYCITLDNKFTLKATPEHLIMKRDGTFEEIQNLKVGDSLMPLYTKYERRKRTWFGDYYTPYIWHNRKMEYMQLAQLVANDYLGPKLSDEKIDLHHIDFNPLNNNPENLVYLSPKEHTSIHAKEQHYWDDPEIKAKISKKSKEMWQDPEYRQKHAFIFDPNTNPMVIAHKKRMKEDEEYRQRAINALQQYRDNTPNWKENITQKMHDLYAEGNERGEQLKQAAREKSLKQWDNDELRKWRAEKTKEQVRMQKENGTAEQIAQKGKNTYYYHVFNAWNKFAQALLDSNIVITKANYIKFRQEYIEQHNITSNNIFSWDRMRKVLEMNFRPTSEDVINKLKDYLNNKEHYKSKYIENYNHKITKIEVVDYNDYVYDLEIEEYHNFAISAGIFIHNSLKLARDPRTTAILPLRGKVLNVEKASFEQFIKSPAIQRIIAACGTGFGKTFNIDDFRYDKLIMACFKGDTKVKMLDGTIKTFEELTELEKQNPNQDYWIYSCKPNGEIVPGKMRHPRITRYVHDTIKVYIDDGGVIETTTDHNFMLRDGTYCEAQNLKAGTSLMPLRTNIIRDRERLYDNFSREYKHTHRVVMEYLDDAEHYGKEWHVHHINKNKLDNRPENMEWLLNSDHSIKHNDNIINYNCSETHKKRIKQLHKQGVYKYLYWGNNGYNQSEKNKESTRQLNRRDDVKLLQKQGKIIHSVACLIRKGQTNLTLDMFKRDNKDFKKLIVNIPTKEKILEVFSSFNEMLTKAIDYEKNELTDDMLNRLTNVKEINNNRVAANLNTKRNSIAKLGKKIFDQHLPFNESSYNIVKKQTSSKAPRWENITQYFDSLEDFKEYSYHYNHKVVKIELIHYDEPIPVYCGTVEEHHNFAVISQDNSGVFVKNCDAGAN